MLVLINLIEDDATNEGIVAESWARLADFVSTHEGFISAKLHKSLGTGASYRYVAISMWESEGAIASILGDVKFLEIAAELNLSGNPSAYEVIDERP
jgi:hypothetical protein